MSLSRENNVYFEPVKALVTHVLQIANLEFVKQTQNALVVGGIAAVGGALGGRIGLLAGGALGTWLTYRNSGSKTANDLVAEMKTAEKRLFFMEIFNKIWSTVEPFIKSWTGKNMSIPKMIIDFIIITVVTYFEEKNYKRIEY